MKNFANNSIHSLKTLNLCQTIETDVHEQKLDTKIYFILFISFLSIILFYTAMIERTITRIHESPTMECLCTQLAIPYGEFVTKLQVNAFHHACGEKILSKILMTGINIKAY